jgi:hypothetical protein
MTEIIGRFHPLLIHLPIGILLFLFIVSLLPQSKWDSMKGAISLGLYISTAGALLSCLAGWLLSRSGEYDESLVDKHLWLGLGTAFLHVITIALPSWRRPLIWITTLVMTIASHYGGSITHGEGFLFGGSETSGEIVMDTAVINPPPSDSLTVQVQEAVLRFPFRDEVKPILQQKCFSCHSSVKKKGGLRLDTEAFIRKGGKNGSILTANNPDKSTLYTHLLLPLDDELHMPPKGKKQLTSNEINIIHRWIAGGAPFMGIETAVTTPAILVANPDVPVPASVETVFTEDENILAPEEPILELGALEQLGIVARQEPGGLSINFVNVGSITPDMIGELNKVGPHVTNLKFGGQEVDDEIIQQLPAFKNLQKLNLAQSAITDKSLFELAKFPALRQLQAYETSITDAGAEALAKLNQLEKLYIWNTRISEAGIKLLKRKNPTLYIETGTAELYHPDSTKKN